MNKTELINKFLEKADLKPHELVYWKHKVSNGFDLIKFMSDFLDYAESEQLLIQRVSYRRELLEALKGIIQCCDGNEPKHEQIYHIANDAVKACNCG